MTTTINIQTSERLKALKIPRERLEAIANEIGETAYADPQWCERENFKILLGHQWGDHKLTISVSKSPERIDVVFLTYEEVRDHLEP